MKKYDTYPDVKNYNLLFITKYFNNKVSYLKVTKINQVRYTLTHRSVILHIISVGAHPNGKIIRLDTKISHNSKKRVKEWCESISKKIFHYAAKIFVAILTIFQKAASVW